MSHDFIDPSESDGKMPVQLKVKLHESGQQTVEQIVLKSPMKVVNNVRNNIKQKVLKSTDSSEPTIESHNSVKNIVANLESIKTIRRNPRKSESLITQKKSSPSDVVNQRTRIIPEHDICAQTPSTTRRISGDAQSKKSDNHADSRGSKKKYSQGETVAKLSTGKNTYEDKTMSLGNETHRKKSTKSTSSTMTSSHDSTQPKVEQYFNKIIPSSTISPNRQRISDKDENLKTVSDIKKVQIAPSKTKDTNSLKPMSSSLSPLQSSRNRTSPVSKLKKTDKLLTLENNINKGLLSPGVDTVDGITLKANSISTKRQSNVETVDKAEHSAPRANHRVSEPKSLDDHKPSRKKSANSRLRMELDAIPPSNTDDNKVTQKKQSNNLHNGQLMTRIVENSPNKTKKSITGCVGDDAVLLSNAERIKKRKPHRAAAASKSSIEASQMINIEETVDDATSVDSTQPLSPAHNSPSSTSRTIERAENKRTKPKRNQSKTMNDKIENSHDKNECRNDNHDVLINDRVTEVLDQGSVSKNLTIKKVRRRSRKDPVIDRTAQTIQSPDEKFPTIQMTNGIIDNTKTNSLSHTSEDKETESRGRNMEQSTESPRKERCREDITDPPKPIENPVRKRGRPPKKRVIEESTKSDSLAAKANNETLMTIETDKIDSDSVILELQHPRRAKKVVELNKDPGDGLSDVEKSEDEDYSKCTQRRRRGGNRGRRRGRRPACAVDTDYIPRSAESRKKHTINEVNDEKSDGIEITCGRCNEKMIREKWTNHNLQKHNNMGWCDGDPVPDYENDEKLWRKVLTVAHKRRKGSLICEKCSVIKKSVFGFISHYKFCGKTDEERHAMKWICPQCGGVFMPSSQDVHERMHRDMESRNKLLALQALSNNGEVEGSRKRKAAEKAATRISEFTALIENQEPATKKPRTIENGIKSLIQRLPKKNSIPTIWKSAWMEAIAAKQPAQCRQVGCTFSTSTLSEIYEHYDNCSFKPTPTFTCKICKYISETMKDMEKHVKDQHASELKEGEDSDFLADESSDESDVGDISTDLPRNRKSIPAQITPFEKAIKYEDRVAFLRNERYYHEGNHKMTFVSALRWTLEFEFDNYRSLAFPDFKPNVSTLLTHNEAQNHLPELTVSMRMHHLKDPVLKSGDMKNKISSIEWKTWDRFESSVVDGFPTFFVGGPVWSMAWLPIPTMLYSQHVNQYIAISTHSKMHDSFAVGKSYKFKNIIQIWNLGDLNHSLSHTPQNPQLVYAIAHEKGTIWSMEWCPSGAYEHLYATSDAKSQSPTPRMGLLAVASSDGCVHIYSLTFPEALKFKKIDTSHLPIYKTNPVVTLEFNHLYHEKNEVNWQCTTLCWSKMHGHDTIAAGFSNGYVALWDLTTKSPLLTTKQGNTLYITSYRFFFAHKQMVSGITIIPLRGRRFLATVSVDRYAKFWDLEDVSNCVAFVKKGMTVNSTWMTHWPNIIGAYDDVLGLGHTTSYMIGLREPCSKAFPLLPTNSPCFGLAASDYANGIAHGTSAGELVAIFPFQMFYYRDLEREKLNRKRWLVSSVEVVDFEEKAPEEDGKVEMKKNDEKSKLKKYVYMPDTYEECSRRFGVVFHNDANNIKKTMMKKSDRKSPLNSESMKSVPVEQYNFASINRVSWNPNAWSYLWFGVGYQNGFIRILHLKSMSMQDSIMNLLPEHVEKQKNKRDKKNNSSLIQDHA